MLHSSSEAPIEAVKEPPALGLSLVVPVFNEAECIGELYAEIDRVLDRLEETVEIIFVDDGSSDGSGAILDTLADKETIRAGHSHNSTCGGRERQPAIAPRQQQVNDAITETITGAAGRYLNKQQLTLIT